MVAANNVAAVLLARVPAEAPASVDMAVVFAPDRDESAEERHLANVGSYPAPELVTPSGEDIHEIGAPRHLGRVGPAVVAVDVLCRGGWRCSLDGGGTPDVAGVAYTVEVAAA